MKFKTLIASLCLSGMLVSTTARAEELDNASVVSLSDAGIGPEAIIAMIATSETNFDVTTQQVIALAQAGVPSDVIAAMVTARGADQRETAAEMSSDNPDPTVPHFPGVYMLNANGAAPRMEVINATTSNQTRSGGFLGYALTAGLAPMSFKTTIPNRNARINTADLRPKFYFYFDQAVNSLSNGARDSFWGAGAVTSPAEFSLVRFDVRRDRREAQVGRFSLIGGARQGVMTEDQIPFDYITISPGVFEVRPTADLEPGEYGFIYSASTGGGPGASGVGAMTSRIFDFSIAGEVED